jgi:galactokinase
VHLTSAKIDRLEVARLCQKAEHEFAGVKCGIMDQFAAVMGSRNGPVYLDCRTMKYRELPLQEGVAVVLCDTKVKHSLGSSEYNKRRAECEEALSILREHVKGLQYLAELPIGEFKLLRHHLREKVARRAEHVVTETRRTFEAAKALASSNPLQLGVLMNASHVSLRDSYEVSCAELDRLVEAAWDQDGVYGSRMTGGGFGGCTVTLADRRQVEKLEGKLEEAYTEAFNTVPDVYVCAPQRGAYVTRMRGKES